VRPCCCYCNKYKSDNDEQVAKLFIQLRKYANLHNLPFTITDEDEYKLLRNGITGGLSNVHNRYNITGLTTIKKLDYSEKKCKIIDTNNIVSHCIGIDFNSLYPSSFSSARHKKCIRQVD
jgi:hypothetical protein